MPHPRFKITKGPSDEYTFNLTAANAEKILSSERYTSHSAAVNGIASVKENAKLEARFERRLAKDETLYFVLRLATARLWGRARRTRQVGRGRAGSRR